MFLNHKDESFDIFFKLCKRVRNEKGVCITLIKSDHEGEFESDWF